MEITINHFSLRAKSSLNTSSDTCAICRENVCDGCIKCQQANENSQCVELKKCFSVVGVCSHTYHYCCIQNCLNGQSYGAKKCPMCNKTWEMKKRSQQPIEQKFKKILKTEKTNQNNQHNQNNQQIEENENVPEAVPGFMSGSDSEDD